MAQKAIREFDAKSMLASLLRQFSPDSKPWFSPYVVQITAESDFAQLEKASPWLRQEKLVAKPDQLIKRRGNNNLILLNEDWDQTKSWVRERLGQTITIDDITGRLDTFLVERFLPHEQKDEYYFAVNSIRGGEELLFSSEGGVDVGEVDEHASKLFIATLDDIKPADVEAKLLTEVPEGRRKALVRFICTSFDVFRQAGYSFLEINPLVMVDDTEVIPLDLAAKIDSTAEFESGHLWGEELHFPAAFGREESREEEYISSLDEKTGASLKFTLLNAKGRIWTLLAGGGASVIYTDTIADLGHANELANYGEYSGNPSDEETYKYTRTIVDLMTREKHPSGQGKVLLIGGGIANFTDVAATFNGIASALTEFKHKLREVGAKIYVRRGGPNYREGLRKIEALGKQLNLPVHVYGPETHMTNIVSMALQ